MWSEDKGALPKTCQNVLCVRVSDRTGLQEIVTVKKKNIMAKKPS